MELCGGGLEIGVCLGCDGLNTEPLDSVRRFSDREGFLGARFGAGNRSDSKSFFLSHSRSENISSLNSLRVISFENVFVRLAARPQRYHCITFGCRYECPAE